MATRKRMKLPNGFGQITKISNKRLRNPYRVMVTVGKDKHGKPICKTLKPNAYFPTYNDAYAALLEYNRNPYDLSKNITCKELFEMWFPIHSESYKPDTVRNYKNVWKACSSIHSKNVRDLMVADVMNIIEQDNIPDAYRSKSKTIITNMLNYAVIHGYVSTNVMLGIQMPKYISCKLYKTSEHHMSFTDSEMKTLWDNVNNPDMKVVDLILIDCYSGWRPSELLKIDIKDGFMYGGLKTEAGKNRFVPIHSKIKDLVNRRYEREDIPKHYSTYYRMFVDDILSLGLNPKHKPHDCRKQFVTMAKYYKMDEYALKRIVGHQIKDITEAVYTDRKPEWYKSEIEKIK